MEEKPWDRNRSYPMSNVTGISLLVVAFGYLTINHSTKILVQCLPLFDGILWCMLTEPWVLSICHFAPYIAEPFGIGLAFIERYLVLLDPGMKGLEWYFTFVGDHSFVA